VHGSDAPPTTPVPKGGIEQSHASSGHASTPGAQSMALGHALPLPLCATTSVHTRSPANSHALVQALQEPSQLTSWAMTTWLRSSSGSSCLAIQTSCPRGSAQQAKKTRQLLRLASQVIACRQSSSLNHPPRTRTVPPPSLPPPVLYRRIGQSTLLRQERLRRSTRQKRRSHTHPETSRPL